MSTTTFLFTRAWDRRLDDVPASQRPAERLYVRGDHLANALVQPTVAIVGARACSSYGRHLAHQLASEFAAAGTTVVSGLARGVDAAAHRGSLDAHGLTIAVLGCGIDRDYPAAHAELARRIAGSGAVVSEYEPGVEPAPWRFPARNRIIAALADVVVVVEARERSGALITVDQAIELGRPVYAIPGETTSPLSVGPNQLIRDGHATLITGAADVVADLEPVALHV